ncbi:hypothetical protein TTHERM_000297069 (macronuclear) [Tetrahymena thermophila SB210]|uniref:Uncharacterized protein n=1 Tax=Tetrahymena thermophila (strain SB210) TaxID=312017 RepID=W7X6U3_TETTS|nr:hypothetical protein TTHERM_000297069 [Tetrahymena thermophila SB210]EWS75095.1 hypothetical protein TTHERM_000297069 [Tetrahymena thermophila SB210]|eukprot:XP_012652333.1 hypothetical protein TTHERM_000297069 [Tetrahymena thermophila SB210]
MNYKNQFNRKDLIKRFRQQLNKFFHQKIQKLKTNQILNGLYSLILMKYQLMDNSDESQQNEQQQTKNDELVEDQFFK